MRLYLPPEGGGQSWCRVHHVTKSDQPPLESLACVNHECPSYGQPGQGNLIEGRIRWIRKTYGPDQIRYLRCQSEFSERRNPPFVEAGQNFKVCRVVPTLEGDQLPVHWPADTLSRSSAFGGRCTHRTRVHAGVVQRVGVRGTWLVWWQVVARDRRLPRDGTVLGEGCCRCSDSPGKPETGLPTTRSAMSGWRRSGPGCDVSGY